MKKIIVMILLLTVLVFSDFIRSENGVVRDNSTQLQWQDEYSDNDGDIKVSSWHDAVNYCEQLILAEKDDWRLPNKNELFSIASFNHYKPGIDPTFLSTNPSHYWTSTSRASNPGIHAWAVNFINGSVHIYNKYSTDFSVRCVRDIL